VRNYVNMIMRMKIIVKMKLGMSIKKAALAGGFSDMISNRFYCDLSVFCSFKLRESTGITAGGGGDACMLGGQAGQGVGEGPPLK